MNIALMHYAAPPVVGGVETVMARQARLLARAGHAVRILAGRGQTWDERIPVEVRPHLDSLDATVLRLKSSLDAGQVPADFSHSSARSKPNYARRWPGSRWSLRITWPRCTRTWRLQRHCTTCRN